MKLIRFMSSGELAKYLNGDQLKNETNWKRAGQRSGSTGFCFFDDSEPPEKRLHYVSGIVNMQTVAVFETKGLRHSEIRKSAGVYRDPDRDTPAFEELLDFTNVKVKRVKEYCMKNYSHKTLRLLKIGKPYRDGQSWGIRWLWKIPEDMA